MNKKERDEAIAVEADKWTDEHIFAGDEPFRAGMESYIAGTNSRAKLEWIVRRTYDMAFENPTHFVDQPGWIDNLKYKSSDQIIAEIAKELEVGE